MDAYRLNFKLYFDPAAEIELASLIPIFHRWIQNRELDELLIDVADYQEVTEGPGVMLIAHEANYSVESIDGRLGLLYARKRPAYGSFADRLHAGLYKALCACRALEREGVLQGLDVPGDRWALRIHDRLLAPDDERTFAAVEPHLKWFLDDLYPGEDCELRREDDPGACFGIRVAAVEKPGVDKLLQRLATAPKGGYRTGRRRSVMTTRSAMRDASIGTRPAATELHLSLELRDELARVVATGYPHETCGVLVGRAGERCIEVERVVEARNLDQQRAGDRYRLDPDDFLAADNAARRDGLEIVGIWHSHPDCPARPSTTDLEAAWEGYSYLIVAITGRGKGLKGNTDFRSWRLDGDRFVDEKILPEDSRRTAAELRFTNPLKEERTS